MPHLAHDPFFFVASVVQIGQLEALAVAGFGEEFPGSLDVVPAHYSFWFPTAQEDCGHRTVRRQHLSAHDLFVGLPVERVRESLANSLVFGGAGLHVQPDVHHLVAGPHRHRHGWVPPVSLHVVSGVDEGDIEIPLLQHQPLGGSLQHGPVDDSGHVPPIPAAPVVVELRESQTIPTIPAFDTIRASAGAVVDEPLRREVTRSPLVALDGSRAHHVDVRQSLPERDVRLGEDDLSRILVDDSHLLHRRDEPCWSSLEVLDSLDRRLDRAGIERPTVVKFHTAAKPERVDLLVR